MTILLDSDVLIEVLRGHDAGIVERWTRVMQSDVTVMYTPVTAAEIWVGARHGEERRIERVFACMEAVPTDSERAGLQDS